MKNIKITIDGIEVGAHLVETHIESKQRFSGDFTTQLTFVINGQLEELTQIARAIGHDSVLKYFTDAQI